MNNKTTGDKFTSSDLGVIPQLFHGYFLNAKELDLAQELVDYLQKELNKRNGVK